MTLRDERTRAITYARLFLIDLISPRATPRVPRAIRLRARAVLKHYPTSLDMVEISEGSKLLDAQEAKKVMQKK